MSESQYIVQNYLNQALKSGGEVAAFHAFAKKVAKYQWSRPYNALLVECQMPGAQLCHTPTGWEKLHRRLKPSSRPLVALKPFGPVQFVFEFRDTEPIPGREDKAEKSRAILLEAKAPTNVRALNRRFLNDAYKFGIQAEPRSFGSGLGGRVQRLEKGAIPPYVSHVDSETGRRVEHQRLFHVTYAEGAEPAERFQSLIHEYAHVLLEHLGPLDHKPVYSTTGAFVGHHKARTLSTAAQEAEAEAVVHLVCHWYGVEEQGVEYLLQHLTEEERQKKSFPAGFMVDKVVSVAGKIMDLAEGTASAVSKLRHEVMPRPQQLGLFPEDSLGAKNPPEKQQSSAARPKDFDPFDPAIGVNPENPFHRSHLRAV